MRFPGVEVDTPCFDGPSGVSQAGEPVLDQAFVAKLAVEAFHEGVLNGLAGLDEVQPDVVAVGPRLADQLRSIIDDDGSGQGQIETGLSL